ncbi:helix-turn-helix transcriptional regulator [Bradyrhizobium tropiciagri]|uniref:AraC family transcriptional regulator n=1 Tax=Bradyrhizobium tropiciagri TaxID=312253 RepID=UPI001BAACD47|nr:helix-turn-helix domain-containing protein [Bradyrhizobium tropiciagri]MBR0893796.1 helix-turn-helix transcriptional regulator [Bradyrhizobium tropiciagri]
MEEARPERFVRQVGGELVSSVIARSKPIRVELLSRTSRPRMNWHFRQPELTLFWFRNGCSRLQAKINGRPVEYEFSEAANLALFPAGTEIEGEWSVGSAFDYVVVFLDPKFVLSRLNGLIERPAIAFGHDQLCRGLAELSHEASAPDNLFNLFAEGWASQALAHMARLSRDLEPAKPISRGGLPALKLRRIEEFVWANLGEPISLSALSDIAGLSKRHFLRAFQESTGTSPHRYVLGLRIEQAKRSLGETDESVTSIALATGFSNAQHFSSTFRQASGVSPSVFRQQRRA